MMNSINEYSTFAMRKLVNEYSRINLKLMHLSIISTYLAI